MRKTIMVGAVVTVALAVVLAQSEVTLAQNGELRGASVTTLVAPTRAAMTTAYWTAERLAAARSLPLPLASSRATIEIAADAAGTPVFSPGAPPRNGGASPVSLFDRSLYSVPGYSEAEEGDGVEARNAGTFGAHFTSSRLIPLAADRQYPYRTVGKLFFTIPGQGDFVCSAAVISYRIVATAGHCVSNGLGGFFTNWVFVPAYRDGVAPYQAWDWSQVVVTNTWHFGGGGVPNAADYAMITVADRFFGTTLTKIGKKVGFLGWQTSSLSQNHTTMLGYPCNLDSCEKMHQVTAGAFRNVAPNNVEYGSDARGGSSGGPWVQNFGVPAVGQGGGLNSGGNRIVGITSYGYIATDPKVQGSSILDDRWIALWNTSCAGAGNCTP